MTDIEITRLCAEAMRLTPYKLSPNGVIQVSSEHSIYVTDDRKDCCFSNYDPLYDDAQAMALVKKFQMQIARNIYGTPHTWVASAYAALHGGNGESEDLNRAICECVAKMQAAKK